MRDFARYVILAPLMTAAVAAPALAQNIPPGQSCGGLFCDMGFVGHKVPVGPDGKSLPEPTVRTASGEVVTVDSDPHHLACHDFVCHAFGQPYGDAPTAAPPAPAPVATVSETPAKPAHKVRRKHLAKAEAAAAQDGAAK